MADTLAMIIEAIRFELEFSRGGKRFPDLADTTSFERDLLCDTLDMVCISHRAEELFGVELPAEELEACLTIGDLAALVDRLRQREAV